MRDISDQELETPLTVDAFAEEFHYPPGMIRLAIECGLETEDGKVTGVGLAYWLSVHYNEFRKVAGFPPLATPNESMTPEERVHLTISNVMITHADYFASRTSSLESKERWMNLSNHLASGIRKSNVWLTPWRRRCNL